MTRVRITLHDSKDTPIDKRLAKAAKWFKSAWGWVSEGIVPLVDNPETPRAIAARMVILREHAPGRWQVLLVTGSGSIIRFLDQYADREAALCGQTWWTEVFAMALEWGGRLYRTGEMEIKG
jgi:hypothetical protein